VPLANSYNALALNNQQPEYQCLWAPLGVSQASTTTTITLPTTAGAGAWIPGAVVSFIAAGVGSNPGPGGDDDGSTAYTVAQVDIAATSATGSTLAGVILGFGALGSYLQAAPNTFAPSQAGPNLTAMVGTKGICQVLVDNTTTVGHTLIVSTTSGHTGQAHDSGGSSFTFGTTIGVALQAVTVSAGPLLCWAKIDIPFGA
jgi:hypothetical protein